MKQFEARIRSWLKDAALPLWADAGLDRECGGFVERLHWKGNPDLSAVKRTRVQARQIYVYSHAAIDGLCPGGADIAGYGFDFLIRHACPEGARNGFVQSVDRRGQVISALRDSYDHAFLLFAFAWLYRATQRADVLAALSDVYDAIEERLLAPDGGLYSNEQQPLERLQNPNMHYLEALLAASIATGRSCFLNSAERLHTLFRSRMFSPCEGVLREVYRADWTPAAYPAGDVVEPGHHCEWVWLLKRYADAQGLTVAEEALRLFAFAMRYGKPTGRLVCDEVWTSGEVKKASTRSWPQTEALKAEIAIAEIEGLALGPAADATVCDLFDRFLDKPVKGGWIDWIDSNGSPLVEFIPASTFYHLYLSFSEYLNHRDLA